MTIAIICGGRGHLPFTTSHFHWLATLHTRLCFTQIIDGGASGADTYGRAWAETHGIDTVTFWANWTRYEKRAGPLRNQRMLDYLLTQHDQRIVLAFAGGKGTADMVHRAESAGIVTYRYPDLS